MALEKSVAPGSRLDSGMRTSSSTISAFCMIRSPILFAIFVAV